MTVLISKLNNKAVVVVVVSDIRKICQTSVGKGTPGHPVSFFFRPHRFSHSS